MSFHPRHLSFLFIFLHFLCIHSLPQPQNNHENQADPDCTTLPARDDPLITNDCYGAAQDWYDFTTGDQVTLSTLSLQESSKLSPSQTAPVAFIRDTCAFVAVIADGEYTVDKPRLTDAVTDIVGTCLAQTSSGGGCMWLYDGKVKACVSPRWSTLKVAADNRWNVEPVSALDVGDPAEKKIKYQKIPGAAEASEEELMAEAILGSRKPGQGAAGMGVT